MRMLGRLLLPIFILVAPCLSQERGLSELASSLSAQIKARVKGPVAVTSFLNTRADSYCPAFNRYLVDRLNILLVKGNSDFDVVTRDRVEEAFKEINLALAKNYDASTFAKIGKHLGAKALIRGSYTIQQQGATISIAAQLLDVESGRIVGGEVQELPLSADVKALLEPQACGGDSLNPGSAGSTVGGTSNQASGSAQQAPQPAGVGRFGIGGARNPVPPVEAITKRAGSLEVSLKSCKLEAEGLRCEALVTNLGEERQYCLVSRADTSMMSRMVDDYGHVKTPFRISLAENSGQMIMWECANLPKGVPVASALLFVADNRSADGKLPQEGSRLKLLEFGFDILNYGTRSPTSFFVQFRDVPVSR
jgi:TolB-like protein